MMIQHHAIVDNIKAISLGGKNFQQASIYVSNVTQHHMRCHPQTVNCHIHNNSVYALNSELTHVTSMVCMHLWLLGEHHLTGI